MPKKKGLTQEEKREILLKIFHKTAEVYQLKDVEKLGSKAGIPLQTVKDVLQSLVDDNLVHGEKVGISTYYWSFPSEASAKIENELKSLKTKVEEAKLKSSQLQEEIKQHSKNEEEKTKEMELINELSFLNEKNNELEVRIAKCKENDPETIKELKDAVDMSKEASNRWLDNIFVLKDWLKKTFPGRDTETNSFFKEQGLSDEADYI